MPKLRKHKIVIDKRVEPRDFEGKLRASQFGGGYVDGSDMVPDAEQFAEAADGAGWSDDPGTGRSILLPDGREVPNPMPLAPPVTIDNGELSVNELVDRALRLHFEKIADDAEANETLDDLLKFDDEPDDFPASPYEIVERDMFEEAPVIPPNAVVAEADPPAPPASTVPVEPPAPKV